jgi:alkylation response protein AidB-like acyl-CoA dehydrogenase
MTLTDTDADLDVRAWLEAQWAPGLTLREWWGNLHAARLAFPTWPAPFGRGWDDDQLAERDAAMVELGALAPPVGLGTMMGGPITLEFGTSEQQERFLPLLADGTHMWCQMFSEPGAGSDLAGLTTTAVRDGDEWVVNGQKVWTSGARNADRGMLIARTDWDAPKHRGLTYFLLDMDTPGIEIRPIVQMNGESHFNEVFFTDVRIPDGDRLGGVGDGWAVAVSTLAHERRNVPAVRTDVPRPNAGERGGNLDRPCRGFIEAHAQGQNVGAEEAGSSSALIDLARAVGRSDDPVIRDRLAQLHIYERLRVLTRARTEAAKEAGRAPGPESSIAKLARTRSMTLARDLAMDLLGARGTLLDGSSLAAHRATINFVLTVPSKSIAGGTDEVQRNLIGERSLGLPKEPSDHATLPFRDTLHGGHPGA